MGNICGKQAVGAVSWNCDYHCLQKFTVFLSCELVVSDGLIMESEEFCLEISSLFYCLQILDDILLQIKIDFSPWEKVTSFAYRTVTCMTDTRTFMFMKTLLKPWRCNIQNFFIISRLRNELPVPYCSQEFKVKPVFQLNKFTGENACK